MYSLAAVGIRQELHSRSRGSSPLQYNSQKKLWPLGVLRNQASPSRSVSMGLMTCCQASPSETIIAASSIIIRLYFRPRAVSGESSDQQSIDPVSPHIEPGPPAFSSSLCWASFIFGLSGAAMFLSSRQASDNIL